MTSPHPLRDELARLAGHRPQDGPPDVLKDTQVLVVRAGGVVAKAHPPGTDPAALAARLRQAGRLAGIMLPPLGTAAADGRVVTLWPAGEPVDPADPAAAPWEAGARLLARLHAVPPEPELPPAGGPARLAEAMARLGDAAGPAADLVRRAYAELDRVPAAPGPPRLTHGDWHLGQLVRHGGEWLLIDVDDLGAGDPAWDLARPAAFFAAGLLDPAVWERFLGAYLAAGGPAVSAEAPWRELDRPARALTVQLAALAISHAREEERALDEAEEALISSCERILRVGTG